MRDNGTRSTATDSSHQTMRPPARASVRLNSVSSPPPSPSAEEKRTPYERS